MNRRIRYLIEYLNKHTALYDAGVPEISDQEWDKFYFELQDLEKRTGLIYSDSPTQKIHYEEVSSLNKITHNHDMLSLEKTKDLSEVKSFLGKKEYLAMSKMDGLTCSLKYENGQLISAETRGNGVIGEDILHNAKVISSIPKEIPYKGTLVVDGEVICSFEDFKTFSGDYKNPRNFASGSIRLLDSKECSKRKLQFVAWEIIEGFSDENHLSGRFMSLSDCGFTVVPYYVGVAETDIDFVVDFLKKESEKFYYPIDGIVFKFNDIEYGKSLGQTSHHFKNALAYKFYDEVYKTKLLNIEWTMGRTGVLTPVAIFESVDIDGTTVSRANIHNISVMRELLNKPFVGQEIEVFKSNMIIPQIYSADNQEKDSIFYFEHPPIDIPMMCPVCGGLTEEITENNSTMLYCTNENCEGKLINKLDHFCSKKGLDIKNLSKATLEKLIEWKWVNSIEDLFTLEEHYMDWIQKPGFGVKSVDRILESINYSKSDVKLYQFIAALGIPLIGVTAAKKLELEFKTWNNFIQAIEDNYKFYNLQDFGVEMHNSIMNFDYSQSKIIAEKYITFTLDLQKQDKVSKLKDKTFVITGKVNHYKNRDELKSVIESLGGRVSSSVSKNTTFLINNDINSASAKNKAAKSLDIPILTEEEFIEKFI